MTNHDERSERHRGTRATLSDAAALMLAKTTGADDAVNLVLRDLAREESAAPLGTTLLAVLQLASDLLRKEAQAVADDPTRRAEGIEYLTAVARHAHHAPADG